MTCGVGNEGWIPHQLKLGLAFLRYRFILFLKQGIMSLEDFIGPMHGIRKRLNECK